MTEPHEYSSTFDKYLCHIVEQLRLKHGKASVNRGRTTITFFWGEDGQSAVYDKAQLEYLQYVQGNISILHLPL